jgi:hypothetical protein
MTILSASALDLDPAGCALLKRVTNPAQRSTARSPWLRAGLGLVGSTGSMIVLLVALASL